LIASFFLSDACENLTKFDNKLNKAALESKLLKIKFWMIWLIMEMFSVYSYKMDKIEIIFIYIFYK